MLAILQLIKRKLLCYIKILTMKNSLHTCLTQNRLTHLKRNKRELIITTTVLVAILIQWFLFRNDNQLSKDIAYLINLYCYDNYTLYYTHLILNFVKSFCILLLCSFAINITDSFRLSYGLNVFLTTSMSLDLLCMLSPDIYHFIKPFRYTNQYNFKDIYATFEIACLLYCCFKLFVGIIKTTFDHYSHRHDVICDTFIIQNDFTRTKKKN